MSEHTKGRLAVKGEWIIPEAHADRMIGSSTNKADDKSNYAHTVAIVRGKYQDDKANARRLAAAWNACEGVATEQLEIISVVEVEAKLMDCIGSVRNDLNAARALLREVVDMVSSEEYNDIIRKADAYLDACDTPGAPT